jgi:hypothetical protein
MDDSFIVHNNSILGTYVSKKNLGFRISAMKYDLHVSDLYPKSSTG